ncbi:MAG: anthranilate synthase component I [Alphaproteobacteria bacterium]|nr:anthranilate synthase component I [Alphaproteobacteria bacterium]
MARPRTTQEPRNVSVTFFPDHSAFEKNLQAGKTQLVWTWLPADLETPVSAYLKIARDEKHSFLLESVEGGAVLGRYSAIGLMPDLIWEYHAKNPNTKDPLGDLRRHVRESRIDVVAPEIPPMGSSGLFGYMGYDMVRLIENIPDQNPDELGIPDSVMIRPTLMVIFDNVQSRMCLVTPVREISGNAQAIRSDAEDRLRRVIDRLSSPIPISYLQARSHLPTPLPVTSNVTEPAFHDSVNKAIDYIRAGDIFQVVLGQRFSLPFDLPAFHLYRTLRRLNPSPFLFYINFGGFSLVGSSPEIMVRVRGGVVTIRPIAGTRKRGETSAEDSALAEDLLSDPKERAEHLMLLDLGRNDVGRVAATGTVKVTEQFTIEKYSHVMHIVSNVEGRLKDGTDSLDALFAGFPAGTVSGAPKVRAMEIIDELETTRRSYYAGCVGYLDGNGDVDTCIALRTALVKDGKVYVQASGGIVADSDPAFEFQESCNKAKAVIQAAQETIMASVASND